MTNIEFQLNPTLPYINVTATKGWFYVNYPSGYSYWTLQDSSGNALMTGNYTFSQEVLSQWTTSDQVLIDALLEAAPWDVKIETTTTSTTTEDVSTTTSTTTIIEN